MDQVKNIEMTDKDTGEITTGEVLDGTMDTAHQIVNQDGVVDQLNSRIQNIKESMESELLKMDEYVRLQELEDEKKALREQLKVKLLENGEYNDLAEELAEAKRDKKNEKQVLSAMLIHYMVERRVQSIPVAGVQRKIDYSAQLGKELDRQQELPL